MLAEKIHFTDAFGIEKDITCYFNYSESEILNMEAGQSESVSEKLVRILGSKDKEQIMTTFTDFILGAYGEPMNDGNVFLKTPEIKERFRCSAMYNELVMKFISEPNKFAQRFINGVMPDMEKLKKKLEEGQKNLPENAANLAGLSNLAG